VRRAAREQRPRRHAIDRLSSRRRATDEYLHPNADSPNQGNEDVIECHKPKGVSGFSDEPFYPGYWQRAGLRKFDSGAS